jgi:membrane-associated protease RseP (regulator of RpoE activity)
MIRISLALVALLLIATLSDQPAWAKSKSYTSKPGSVEVIRIVDKDGDEDDDDDSDSGTWLGVQIQDLDDDLRDGLDLPGSVDGVLVSNVYDDSPAEKAGIEDGDVITAIDGKEVDDTGELTDAIHAKKPGDRIRITLFRESEKDEISKDVTLGEAKLLRDRAFRMRRTPGGFHWDDGAGIAPRALRTPRTPRTPHPGTGEHRMLFATSDRGRIGVFIQDLNEGLNDYFSVPGGKGALVVEVVDDSPAEKAGIRAGDVIVSVDGKEVSDGDDLRKLVAKHDGGDRVTLEAYRKGGKTEFTVEVEETSNDFAFGPGWFRFDDSPRGRGRAAPPGLSGEDEEHLRRQLDDLRKELDELRDELREMEKDR